MQSIERVKLGVNNLDLNRYEAIIFDLDGTILNSLTEVMLCLEEAFLLENLWIDKSRLNHNIIGPPLDIIVKTVLPEITDEMALRVVEHYNRIYDSEKYQGSFLYDGMIELLDSLKKSGKKLFIATNKPHKSTLRLVNNFNLLMFDDIYSIDKMEGKIMSKSEMILDIVSKYNFDKKKVVMIGDALGDVIAANESGVDSIAALWGYGDDKQPLKDSAKFLIENVNDLLRV